MSKKTPLLPFDGPCDLRRYVNETGQRKCKFTNLQVLEYAKNENYDMVCYLATPQPLDHAIGIVQNLPFRDEVDGSKKIEGHKYSISEFLRNEYAAGQLFQAFLLSHLMETKGNHAPIMDKLRIEIILDGMQKRYPLGMIRDYIHSSLNGRKLELNENKIKTLFGNPFFPLLIDMRVIRVPGVNSMQNIKELVTKNFTKVKMSKLGKLVRKSLQILSTAGFSNSGHTGEEETITMMMRKDLGLISNSHDALDALHLFDIIYEEEEEEEVENEEVSLMIDKLQKGEDTYCLWYYLHVFHGNKYNDFTKMESYINSAIGKGISVPALTELFPDVRDEERKPKVEQTEVEAYGRLNQEVLMYCMKQRHHDDQHSENTPLIILYWLRVYFHLPLDPGTILPKDLIPIADILQANPSVGITY